MLGKLRIACHNTVSLLTKNNINIPHRTYAINDYEINIKKQNVIKYHIPHPTLKEMPANLAGSHPLVFHPDYHNPNNPDQIIVCANITHSKKPIYDFESKTWMIPEFIENGADGLPRYLVIYPKPYIGYRSNFINSTLISLGFFNKTKAKPILDAAEKKYNWDQYYNDKTI